MVNEGIVLGHKFFERGIEVDKAMVDAIEKMQCPKGIKDIHNFLGHAGLYNAPPTFQRCMMAIFSDFCEKICEVLMDDSPFMDPLLMIA